MRIIFASFLALIITIGVTIGAAGARNPEYGTPLTPGAGVAFLGMTLIDTSTEGAYTGTRPDEFARIELLEAAVAERMTAEGFRLMDLAPVRAELDGIVNPANCYGCEVRMAKKLGADYVLVGEVQKVSNLILSMNLVMRSAESGNMVRGLSVDIRANTDKSWLRGINYIFTNHFFKEE